jgi:cytochrome c
MFRFTEEGLAMRRQLIARPNTMPAMFAAALVAAAFLVKPVPVLAQQQGSVSTASSAAAAAKPWSSIGRPATRSEIKAWDIDVRADLKGLPPGSGSVDHGMEIWEAKCASCHGTFGESNEVFTPIAGGTTKDDIRSGRVANLRRTDYPQRTTMMKLSQISTLWDYINRAMPWNEPKSLKPNEVYAVTAYILNLADIVPADFVLSDKNMAEVQKQLPNRDGKVTYPGLWLVDGKPDVQGDACMSNCAVALDIGSMLPEFARNAHGNLAEQNRPVGPARGADTTGPAPASATEAVSRAKAATVAAAAPALAASASGAPAGGAVGAGTAGTSAGGAAASAGGSAASGAAAASKNAGADLAKSANCMACHGVANKLVGPGFREVAERYRGKADAEVTLAVRVKQGGQGVWGPIPMPPHPQLADPDIRAMVRWVLDGAP